MVVVFFTTLLDLLLKKQISKAQSALPSVVSWFVIIFAPVVIMLTLTRGNWVGFLAGIFVFFYLSRRLIGFHGRVKMIGGTLIVLPAVVLSLLMVVPESVFEQRVANADNVVGRIATWRAAISIVLDNPILGSGLNSSTEILSRKIVVLDGLTSWANSHNSFLAILMELGAVGLFAYLAVIINMFQTGLSLYKQRDHVQDQLRGVAFVAIMVAYLTPSLFATTLYLPDLGHLYVFGFTGAIKGLYSGYASTSRLSRFQFARPERASNQLLPRRLS